MPTSSGTTDRARRALPLLLATALLLSALAWPALSPLPGGTAVAGAAPADGAAQADGGPVAVASGGKARFGPAVLAELNRIRAQHDLPPVRIDERMSRTAAAHSREMARNGSIAHGAWSSRVARASGSAAAVGEVLGWLQRAHPRAEARRVVRDWLGSAPHRVVLLDGSFRRVGIGRAAGRVGGLPSAIYTVDWASAR